MHSEMAALLFILACTENTQPTGPREGTAAAPPPTMARAVSIDDEFARAARADVPGFAGYYIREDGRLVIQLARGGQRLAAEQFVGALRARRAPMRQAPIIQAVNYDFVQLQAFRERLRPSLSTAGLLSLDLDEVANRVRIGVRNRNVAQRVLASAARAGLPADAFTVEVEAEPELRLTLRDRAPSMQGGFQITRTPYSISEKCTLGFNALLGSQKIFVSASHCSRWPYGANQGDTSRQHQPDGEANLIGQEIKDKGFAVCVPLLGWRCRNSDAAYWAYRSGVSVDHGYIANTSTSSTIDPALPRLRITRRLSDSEVAVGDSLSKVGRSTGKTKGRVIGTCVDVWTGGHYFECTYTSTIRSTNGDSGSPVFEQAGGDAYLHGLMFGGPNGDPNITWHSTLGGVEADLGAIKVCPPAKGVCPC